MGTLFIISVLLFYGWVLRKQKKEIEQLKRQIVSMMEHLPLSNAKLRAPPRQASEDTATSTEQATPEKWREEEFRKREENAPVFPASQAAVFPSLEDMTPAVMKMPSVAVATGGHGHDATRMAESIGTMPQVTSTAASPRWLERFLAWCVGGNPLVRVGILILFLGVSFLLKLVADYGWFPIELRLAGVALGAAVMLGIGWRLRNKRRSYGLLLQGGGIGILYLVIYAAFAYFDLFPGESALFAFFLLFVICALSAFLAVRQDASALAVMGMTGGFMAPVLISTGSGNHIALFSYFALLNAGVLGIAWFRAWRALNLLGFVFTLGIGSLWGLKYYTFAHFQSVECFLVLFFLYYVAVALLYAVRRELELKHYVDGTLVFGVPIAFSLLQAQLVSEIEFGMAWSAVALGAFYLLLAMWLARYRLERLRLMFESMLALGVLFLTLAVPLAFEGTRLTGAIWAVEGAGLCWVAIRQQRRLALTSGLALQIFAAISFSLDRSGESLWDAALLFNSWYIGTLMLALPALFCSWRLRSDAAKSWLGTLAQSLSWLSGGVGLLWWLGGGSTEILRYFGPFVVASYAYLTFAVLTAWLAHSVGRRLRWAEMELVALALPPVLLFAAVLSFLHDLLPFADGGWYVWPLTVILAYTLLRQQERRAVQQPFFSGFLGPLHVLMFWTLCLIASLAFHGFVVTHVPEGTWQWSSWAFVGALLLLALIHIAPRFGWPVARFRSHYLTLGAAPIVLLASGWAFLGVFSDGNPDPLPYLPFLNPVELCQLLVFATVFSWVREIKAFFGAWPHVKAGILHEWLPIGALALLFLLLNAVLLRTLHYWLEIPYRLDALYASMTVQTALSLLWGLLALILMVWAVRRAQRISWFVGISLLVLTVGKLFFVELSTIGGTARVFSFIGVGLLLLLIGYVAPLPPKKKENV
ncbi:MAG: DUF2339 domain-containing protein [Burkholderiales bacterium]|nr:DUF2339 domain-containing protein [Burkholderiales bacterium]